MAYCLFGIEPLPVHVMTYYQSGPLGTYLTHWGRVTHKRVSDLTSIGSYNGLSPGRRQAIIRTNAGILLIRPLGTNLSELLVEILIFLFKKIRLKVSSAKRRPFCLGLNELTEIWIEIKPFSFKKLIWNVVCKMVTILSWPKYVRNFISDAL